MIANVPDPVTLGVIVVSLGGFVAVMIRWLMTRQDSLTDQQGKMNEKSREDALRREERLQQRVDSQAEFNKTAVLTLQSIATNLTTISDRVDSIPDHIETLGKRVDDLPNRVAERLDCRKTRP